MTGLRPEALSALLIWTLALGAPLRAAPWVVFSEIHYNPGDDDPTSGRSSLEFVEILNLEPPTLELGGWRLEGEVTFEFAAGTTVSPGQCIVVARDPRTLAKKYPEAEHIVGPFAGKLDNKGGTLRLRNRAGARIAEMRYGRRGRWPSIADGAGHSLELADPYFDPLSPDSWRASERRGGTPGTVPSRRKEPAGRRIIREGDVWKFFRGRVAPPASWNVNGFDDSSWESGPSGFGFADGDDATTIDDMGGNYLSLYTRRVFPVEDPAKLGRLVLAVDYDDGFVAYLNGEEICRQNMGPAGAGVPFDAAAQTSREAGTMAEFPIAAAERLLRAGDNVLAVEVHNRSLQSSDLTLIVELLERRRVDRTVLDEALPRINEVCPSQGWLELYNPGDSRLSLGGAFLSDDPAELEKLSLPAGTVLEPLGFLELTLREVDTSGRLSLDGKPLRLLLTAPEGDRVWDSLYVGDESANREDGGSSGRYPDGAVSVEPLAVPTPAAPNRPGAGTQLVINEILYHSIRGNENEDFLEIHNRGEQKVELGGYRLRGGLRFDFAPGQSIEAGAYLVVARDPEGLRSAQELAESQVTGPFEGRLSNREDSIRLIDPRGRSVDRVRYSDRSPWPIWADGGGASLELIHPALDNSLPSAWAASDETARTEWRSYEYRKAFDVGRHEAAPSFQFLILNDGECLIDDVIVKEPTGEALIDEDFQDRQIDGVALGTHGGSGIEADPDDPGNLCYHIRARGRGNSRHNYVSLRIPTALLGKREYLVSFRARWLRGAPLLLSRTAGQGLARLHRLAVPARTGTPGRRNSRWREHPAPCVATPVQHPVAPSSGEPVLVRTKVSSPGELEEVTLRYRLDGSTTWTGLAMTDAGENSDDVAGDGRYSARIPALPGGVVEYYIEARDRSGASGFFPAAGPSATALYAVGLATGARFPTYTILVAQREWQRWEMLRATARMSNRPMNATLIYENKRLFHNVGLRLRGSPFTRSRRNWRLTFGAETLDGRRSLTLDGQGNLRERLTYWLVDELDAPTVRQRWVHVNILGHEEGDYEDVEKVDGDFLDRWFDEVRGETAESPPGKGELPGLLHKVDDHWELAPQGGFRSFGFRGRGGSYVEAHFDYRGPDPELYRWNFPPRANGVEEDFRPLIELVRLLDPAATPDAEFRAKVETKVDVDEWLRVLAARALVNDWDSIGMTRGKNAFVYRSPRDGRWRLIPWDADLSWGTRRSYSNRLFTRAFPAIRRLLDQPAYHRQFLSYVAYLARREISGGRFLRILDEHEEHTRISPSPYRAFASERLFDILPQLPSAPFAVRSTRRRASSDGPDRALLEGVAPALVHRITVNGREGRIEFSDDTSWSGEFPIGSGGGTIEVIARDFGGEELARTSTSIPARPEAESLDALAPEAVKVEILRGAAALRKRHLTEQDAVAANLPESAITRRRAARAPVKLPRPDQKELQAILEAIQNASREKAGDLTRRPAEKAPSTHAVTRSTQQAPAPSRIEHFRDGPHWPVALVTFCAVLGLGAIVAAALLMRRGR